MKRLTVALELTRIRRRCGKRFARTGLERCREHVRRQRPSLTARCAMQALDERPIEERRPRLRHADPCARMASRKMPPTSSAFRAPTPFTVISDATDEG